MEYHILYFLLHKRVSFLILYYISNENKFYEENKNNVYSQNGEDGCIKAILTKLAIKSGWICEFGAWDGVHLSNTFALIEKGFNGVFIEGDRAKFENLKKTADKFPNITPVCSYVDHREDSKHTLDDILVRTDCVENFVLLSIDIDSYDYQVWKSFRNYRPRIVIIEINSAVDPSRMDYIHDPAQGMQGTSFGPTLQLAKEKGYQLLCHTGNMIFIRDEDAGAFEIPKDPISCFRQDWIK